MVVARVLEIGAIAGADRIRLVVGRRRWRSRSRWCAGRGTSTRATSCRFAPVGLGAPRGLRDQPAQDERRRLQRHAVLGPRARAVRRPRGDPASCGDEAPGEPGTPLDRRARDRARHRLRHRRRGQPSRRLVHGRDRPRPGRPRCDLPFTLPEPPGAGGRAGPPVASGRPRWRSSTTTCAPASPARVLRRRGGRARRRDWIARRLTLAGMRPINNVVDASNYVMLELGPAHPSLRPRPAWPAAACGSGRPGPGETVTTLDGVERRMGERSVGHGRRPAGLPHLRRRRRAHRHRRDHGRGLAARSPTTTTGSCSRRPTSRPWPSPGRSKRLGLRSEASARFERGCDPEGIDRAAAASVRAAGCHRRAERYRNAERRRSTCAAARARPGPGHGAHGAGERRARQRPRRRPGRRVPRAHRVHVRARRSPGVLEVTVPTFRPDTEPRDRRDRGGGPPPRLRATCPGARPGHPQVGRLTPYQRERRQVREVLAGSGPHEAWTPSLLGPDQQSTRRASTAGCGSRTPSPPTRACCARACCRACSVRSPSTPTVVRATSGSSRWATSSRRPGPSGWPRPWPVRARRVIDEREVLAVALAAEGDDARVAAAAWQVLADAFGLDGRGARRPRRRRCRRRGVGARRACTRPVRRTSSCRAGAGGRAPSSASSARSTPGSSRTSGSMPTRRRVGWLEVDLEVAARRGTPPQRSCSPR